jgi:hypothetical protein
MKKSIDVHGLCHAPDLLPHVRVNVGRHLLTARKLTRLGNPYTMHSMRTG